VSLSADRLNTLRYWDFLATVLPWQLEGVPLAMRQRLRLQPYADPARYVEVICQCLKVTCPGRQIGDRGPISWLHLSLDVIPIDLYSS
jgi:hypothetical protein